MDKELLAAAAALNVRTDGLDERALACAVLDAAGTNPRSPSSASNTTPIQDREPAYLRARATSAAEYAIRDRADAARRDSFATVKRHDAPAPSCGCGGSGKLNAPVKTDALSAERAAKRANEEWSRNAHKQKTIADATDGHRSMVNAPARKVAPVRADGASRELQAKLANEAWSRNAHKTSNTNAIEED